jgi:hypothetical protein
MPNAQFGDVAAVSLGFDTSTVDVGVAGTALVKGSMPVWYSTKNGGSNISPARLYNPVDTNDPQQVTSVSGPVADKENGYFVAISATRQGANQSEAAQISGSDLNADNNRYKFSDRHRKEKQKYED